MSEGTATNSSDFTFDDSSNGQLIFEPGEITKSVSVNIINDTLPEMNETLLLNLTSQDGITNIADKTVEILILDNGKYPLVFVCFFVCFLSMKQLCIDKISNLGRYPRHL